MTALPISQLLGHVQNYGKAAGAKMLKWLLIAAGGALGSMLRYAVHHWIHRATTTEFPLGTLVVNVVGCLLIGFLATVFSGPLPLKDEYRLGILVGLLGGFTTFSTFGWETWGKLQSGQIVMAALNVALSCGLGLFACWAGYLAAKRLYGA